MQPIAPKATIVLLAVGLQKPSQKLKAKDHQECLAKRLVLWKEGEIDKLLREGRMIQKRLDNSRRVVLQQPFLRTLLCQGKSTRACVISATTMGGGGVGGVLPLSDDVMAQLREKHRTPQETRLGSLLSRPVEDVPDSIYQQINGEIVRDAALRTKVSGGPSGVEANGFRRILASKSFKRSGKDLFAAIAAMARRLCTECIDPLRIETILASRLIAMDKGEGSVRPIGFGEVIRRIMGKCVMHVTKPAAIGASGSLQFCARHNSSKLTKAERQLQGLPRQPVPTDEIF